MKVVLPVAGRGRRLGPLTDDRPKALVPVAGRTLLDRALDPVDALAPGLITEVVLVVGHRADAILLWCRERAGGPFHVARQPVLDGQVGALAAVADRLDGPVLILFCDTLHDADIAALAALADRPDAPDGVLHVKRVEDPSRFGVAVVDEGGYVKQLVEKPEHPVSDLGIVGVYWIKDGGWLARAVRILRAAAREDDGEAYLADALQIMIDEGARFEARPVRRWLDCGTLESLSEVERILAEERPEPAPTAAAP